MPYQFAKLFDTAHGQLLLVRNTDPDSGRPQNQVLVHPPDGVFNLFSTSGQYPDTDDGRARRDACFEAFDQAKAEELADDLLNTLDTFAPA